MTDPTPDTHDLRAGVPLHDRLLALLPLVGRWRGVGAGIAPESGNQFAFGQQVTFTHDGRPFLAYESRSWLLDQDGNTVRQAWRESGFWRPGATDDDIEVALASNTGQTLAFVGRAGDLRWEIATVSAVPLPTAVTVDGERRLYAMADDLLRYATELAPAGHDYAPHLNAQLVRV